MEPSPHALKNSHVLSLAGLDPSGGAGLLMDVKVWEHLQIPSLGVVSCLTAQTHDKVYGAEFFSTTKIMEQLLPLLRRYEIAAVKIGLIQNFEALRKVAQVIREIQPRCLLLWDPILGSSSGYTFHKGLSWEHFCDAAAMVDWVLPNGEEFRRLCPGDLVSSAKSLSETCRLVITSHLKNQESCTDVYYWQGKEALLTTPQTGTSKHGTGCVYGAALTAALVKRMSPTAACIYAQRITARYRESGEGTEGVLYDLPAMQEEALV